MASPLAVTAVLAALLSRVDLPGPATSWPLATLFIIALQVSGVLVARELERPAWRRVWILALLTTAVALPVLGLLAASLRTPFVSLALGSAWSAIWLTVAAVVVLVGLALVVALLAADTPEQASLLFIPVALLCPAILGVPGTLDERTALLAFAETFGVAAVAVLIGWLAPRGARPLVGPIALGAQFVVLWGIGYTPPFPPGQGAIVPVLAMLVLGVTVVAAVMVPLGALVARRLLAAIHDEAARPRAAAAPVPPPAPRRDERSL